MTYFSADFALNVNCRFPQAPPPATAGVARP